MIAKKRKRKIQEVNAGSMADIAFLLLIFFLVATTIEIDEGIRKDMPFKVENPIPYEFIKRNVLEIKMNSNDELFVEGEVIPEDMLEESVRHFYTANIHRETDVNMPTYEDITLSACVASLAALELKIKEEPTNLQHKESKQKWETRLAVCQQMPQGKYQEINNMAIIQIDQQGATTFGAYMFVLNTTKRVINELRVQKCKEIWDKDYYALDKTSKMDASILAKLKVVIPERIIEKPIQR